MAFTLRRVYGDEVMMLSWLVESAIKISNIDSNSRYKLNFAAGVGACDPKYRN
ncbi:hypothetical protein [Teredinibacter franksiae]|uniref:hypothetical protein n=1 Tax=Teredinibacter franksiae TaxID=2761453 RepID=UPI0016242794|nr:hypothetical protein [Teredinibacter franksiae]